MTRQCQAKNCQNPAASRYSRHCRHHKSTLRRQGAIDQVGIRKSELNPFLATVRRRIERNPDSPLWPELDDAWVGIVSDARYEAQKQIGNRYERSAANEVLNIDADAPTREIVTTAVAMFIHWKEHPGRYVSDNAFRVQLARRVRALSARHRGSVYDHTQGRQRAIYREMTPKAGAILGHKLAKAFGFAGLQIAEFEERERKQAQQSRQSIMDSIKELK